MSFDLTMFEVREGETVETARMRITEPGPPTPDGERVRRETVAALLVHDPELDVYETSALTELTSLDDSKPVQATVYGDQASITIPYLHGGGEVRAAMAAAWRLVEVIHERTGWILYDEQLGKKVDIAAGPEQLVGGYEYGTAAVAEVLATSESSNDDAHGERTVPRRRRRRFWPF